MIKKIFVDSDFNVYKDTNAENKLKDCNDLKYYSGENEGVVKVDINRWKEAQKYEKTTWLNHALNFSNDRNDFHFNKFNQYFELLDYFKNNNITKLTNICELGCGPFTNVRLLLPMLINVDIENIDLIDPLIIDYLSHPHCSYQNQIMNGYPVNLINSPIEDLPINKKYDLIIITNVLEHCYDVKQIFNNILSLLSSNGILIFSDVFFTKNTIKTIVTNTYDIGHPIRLSEGILNEFLSYFKPIYNETFIGLYNSDIMGDARHDIYYIGTKKNEFNE